MKSILVAACLLLVALAGCSDDGGTSSSGGNATSSDKVAEKPEWNITDFWTYQYSDGESVTHVVALQESNNWQVLPTSLSTALFDWSPGISFVGTIAQSTLGGQQDGGFVEFFNFPIEHNETWQTSWDGETRHLTAHGMDNGDWHIRAVTPGTGATFAEYVYNPDVKWFKELTFYNETDGTEQFSLELTDSGTGFTGDVYRYTEVEMTYNLESNAAGTPQGKITVKDTVSELLISMKIECGTWAGPAGIGMQVPQEDGSAQLAPPVLAVIDQGPETYGQFGNCPQINDEYEWLLDEVTPGDWRIDGVMGEGMEIVTFHVEERTYETITFGA